MAQQAANGPVRMSQALKSICLILSQPIQELGELPFPIWKWVDRGGASVKLNGISLRRSPLASTSPELHGSLWIKSRTLLC